MIIHLILICFVAHTHAELNPFITHLNEYQVSQQHTIDAYTKKAQELNQKQEYPKAIALYKKIIDLKPDDYLSYVALGDAYRNNGQLDLSLATYVQALEKRPATQSFSSLGNGMLNLGNIFFNTHESQKALQTFKMILTLSEQISAVHHNLGFTHAEQTGDFAQAIYHYKRSLELKPDSIETHFCYAMALLASGDLINGFKEYEYRWYRTTASPRSFKYPLDKLWQGQDITGKRVLLNVEQGLGDTLQFVRYAQHLKEKGATVIAEVQKPLVDILAYCPFLDEIFAIGQSKPPFDYQVPIVNLPLVFKTTVDTIPAQVPYIRANPTLIAQWRSEITKDTNFKIGICWRGDPAHGPAKFLPFSYFAKLAQLPGISLYCLQKIEPESKEETELNSCDNIHIFAGDFDQSRGRFCDTAAVMHHLDLVLTVDTSIVHLAGAMAIPTWVVLPSPAEWRWLTNRDDSPWYPTVRLFRQTEYGNWDDVYNLMVHALQEKIKK